MRALPNIIITGTPGTGKSTHSERLAALLPDLTYLSVNAFIVENALQDGYDEDRQSAMVDEDKLVDQLEPVLDKGGQIVDWHVCDIFPEDLIDLVVVLRTNTTRLYDRLKDRGYADKKFDDNVDAEIMDVILNDAKDAYAPEIVIELESNTAEDVDSNCERIEQWVRQWITDNAKDDDDEEDGEDDEER
ncbi:AAA domain-containing protein [Limtongia smithiae]|uniref:AAA domain-containing protein n=1 Tax=Limtongia smithiae TaxID=1125753 RepID=UPI0034CDAC10